MSGFKSWLYENDIVCFVLKANHTRMQIREKTLLWPNLSCLDLPVVRIFYICYFISTFINSFPYCGPTRPPGAMILINYLSYYVRELSCKLQLF
jgi:hypothetical protein